MVLIMLIIILKEKLEKISVSNLGRLSEKTKSENIGVDSKGFMARKSVKIPILGQPVDL